jgi:hypothetical protein
LQGWRQGCFTAYMLFQYVSSRKRYVSLQSQQLQQCRG